jgi:dynein heavy chain
MYKAEKDYYESKEIIVKLWCHEILRVFHDRLIDFGD